MVAGLFKVIISLTISIISCEAKVFVSNIFSGSDFLDPARIQTAGQYLTLHQLTRNLIKLDKNAQIRGDLASNWSVEENFTKFRFKIDKKKFSDGSLITASDVVNTLKRQMKINKANHYNFDAIKRVNTLNENEVEIVLKKRNVKFIRLLAYPEFGILHSSDINRKEKETTFKVSSGAYYLNEVGKDFYVIKKNDFFEKHNQKSPQIVKFEWSTKSQKLKSLQEGKIDFAIPFDPLNKEEFNKILINKELRVTYPAIGYTYWLTINPRTKFGSSKDRRKELQKILRNAEWEIGKEPLWEKADQLYLPGGFGRPDESSLNLAWKKIDEIKIEHLKDEELRVIILKDFPFIKSLKSVLTKKGLKLQIDVAESAGDFFNKIKSKKYDVIQARNDFSAVDLHENLQTTLNPNNPLVITTEEKRQYQSELNSSLNYNDDAERHKVYEKIALDLINEGYVFPVAYKRVFFVNKKNVDISAWSSLYPEVSMWKVEVNE